MTKVRALTPDLQKVAIEELNEVPERLTADIEALRAWIIQQPHLRARTDDQFLLAYLRGCKFSLEKAKSKIDKYFMLRSKFPETFRCTDVDEPRARAIIRLGFAVQLPQPLNEDGPRIGIFRVGCYHPEEYKFEEIIPVAQALNEIITYEDDLCLIKGLISIIDMAGVTAKHLLQLSPSLLKKIAVYSEEALALRPQSSHFINVPAGFVPIFNAIKPMLPKKQQERLFVHGSNLASLYKRVPQKYLPKEYGGENGSIPELIDYWERKMLSYRDHFKEDINYGTDEHLRPGKPIDFQNIFGLEGSFRKLDVD